MHFKGGRCVWVGPDKQIDVRRLKKWARKKLPRDSKVRELILLDADCMLPEAFLTKIEVWLSLYDIEHNHQKKETR